VVFAVSEAQEPVGMAADSFTQDGRVNGADVDEFDDAALAQAPGRDRTDAPERFDRQLLEEVLDAFRWNDSQPVGFTPCRGDLREELVRGHAGRSRQAGGLPDFGFESSRYACRERFAPRVLGHVE